MNFELNELLYSKQHGTFRSNFYKKFSFCCAFASFVVLFAAFNNDAMVIFSYPMILLFLVVTIACSRLLVVKPIEHSIFCFLCLFLWIGYILKYALILHDPSLVWGYDQGLFNASSIINSIPAIFVSAVPALVLFALGFTLVALSGKNAVTRVKLRVIPKSLPLYIALILTGFRAFLQIKFSVGSALVSGEGIPALLLALFEFFVQDACLVLVNVCVIYYFVANDKRWLVVFFLALMNVGLSLYGGWKAEMVYQSLAIIFYISVFYRAFSPSRRKILLIGTVALVVGSLLTYPFVNHYRHALKANTGSGISVLAVQASRQADNETALKKIFERVSGISSYYASLELGRGQNYPVGAILDNSLGQTLKYNLYGDRYEEVSVGFGSSQFATLKLVFGDYLFYPTSFLLGCFLALFIRFIRTVVINNVQVMFAYLPFLSFSMSTILLAGGNFSLKSKEYLVVLAALFFITKILFIQNGTANRRNH